MVNLESEEKSSDKNLSTEEEPHDPYYPPIVSLPEVEVKTGEDDEEELVKMRAKLFRFDITAEPPEWKERGTGEMKLLRHREKKTVRFLMRRDKTHKVCGNHFIQPWMLLKTMKNSDRAWMWQVQNDFADEEPKQETLAIRFANADIAKKFKDEFYKAVTLVTELEAKKINLSENATSQDDKKSASEEIQKKTDSTAEKLESLSIQK